MMRTILAICLIAFLIGCERHEADPTRVMRSLQRMVNDLDSIRSRHPEVTDTAVRDETFPAMFFGFVEQVPGYKLPDRFAMFTLSGDAEVKVVLSRFIKDGIEEAKACGFDTPQKRFAAFEDLRASSRGGMPRSAFFGSAGSYEAARRIYLR